MKIKRETNRQQQSSSSTHSGTLTKIALICLVIIFVVAAFLSCQFLLGFPFAWLLKHTAISANFAQFSYTLTTYIATILIIIYAPKLFNKSWRTTRKDLGLLGLPTYSDLLLAPAGFIIFLIVSAIATAILRIFPWFNATESQAIGFSYSYGLDRLFALFAIIIVAPIAEEIIFRGFLYGKLKTIILKRFNQQTTAVQNSQKKTTKSQTHAIIIATILTSLVFAALHLTFDAQGVHQLNVAVNVFIMSIFLCVMREISDSIYAGILLHMIKNALAFYILFNMI